MVPAEMFSRKVDVSLWLLSNTVEATELTWKKHGIASDILVAPADVESVDEWQTRQTKTD